MKGALQTMKLSQYYFPLFENFDRGIPLEIKYLAIVESALKPSVKLQLAQLSMAVYVFNWKTRLEVSSCDERCDHSIYNCKGKILKSLQKKF